MSSKLSWFQVQVAGKLRAFNYASTMKVSRPTLRMHLTTWWQLHAHVAEQMCFSVSRLELAVPRSTAKLAGLMSCVVSRYTSQQRGRKALTDL
jgi:hypothetical protein